MDLAVVGPALPVGIELAGGANHPQQAPALEQLVVGKLAPRRRRGDFLVGEVEAQAAGPAVAARAGLGAASSVA